MISAVADARACPAWVEHVLAQEGIDEKLAGGALGP